MKGTGMVTSRMAADLSAAALRGIGLLALVGLWAAALGFVLPPSAAPIPSVQAQTHTPPRGSPERAAILDAVRDPVQRRIGKPVIFVVRTLRVMGEAGVVWAFVAAEPRNPDGSRVDYTGTPFEDAVRAEVFGGLVHALLRRDAGAQGGRWRLVTQAIGASDVPYVHWWRRFGAPRAVLPYSED